MNQTCQTPGNAQMVSSSPPLGGRYRLRIGGTTVTDDGSGGCSNGRRIYYAVLWEDAARDDANKPALLRARPEDY